MVNEGIDHGNDVKYVMQCAHDFPRNLQETEKSYCKIQIDHNFPWTTLL